LQAVASGGGKLPEEPITNPAADIPTDVEGDETEAELDTNDLEEILAGTASAPAGRRARSAVTSAVQAVAQTVRQTGQRAKVRILRFHEAAPSLQDSLKVRNSFSTLILSQTAKHWLSRLFVL
jgi:hypothetical protein